MTGGFLDRRPVRPLGLGLIVGAHVLVVLALATAVQTIRHPESRPIWIDSIDAPKPPPPPDPHPKVNPDKPHQTQATELTNPDVLVKTDAVSDLKTDLTPIRATDVTPVSGADEKGDAGPITPTKPAPVLVDATVDQRYAGDLQPPYPAALQRSGTEGSVTVRVRVGSDGRVREVQQVSATDPLFFAATEKQALKRWRFRAATRDGMPEESWLIETVRFRLDEL